jgi:hypothetical protein
MAVDLCAEAESCIEAGDLAAAEQCLKRADEYAAEAQTAIDSQPRCSDLLVQDAMPWSVWLPTAAERAEKPDADQFELDLEACRAEMDLCERDRRPYTGITRAPTLAEQRMRRRPGLRVRAVRVHADINDVWDRELLLEPDPFRKPEPVLIRRSRPFTCRIYPRTGGIELM